MVEQYPLRPEGTPFRYHSVRTLMLFMLVFLLAVFLVAGTGVQAVEQAPSMPHVFFGMVNVSDQPAPAGVQVEARGAGVRTGIKGNPITTASTGLYGGAGSYDPKLIVQGEISTNTPIEFYVNGVRAEVFDVASNTGWMDSYPWKSAEYTNMNLRVASLPDTFVTTAPTTSVNTTVPVTTTITTYRTVVASGGGGGGGGGGGYTGSVASATTAATKNVTTVQTTIPAQNITEEPTRAEKTTVVVAGTEEVTGTPTQEPTKPSGAFPIPMNPLTGIVSVMIVIGLIIFQSKRKE